MNKSRIQTLETVLYGLAILILIFLKSLSEAGFATVAIACSGVFIVTALCLPQWERNHCQWDVKSIPTSVKVILGVVIFVGCLAVNNTVCEVRLGGTELVPNFFLAIILQSVTLLVGAGIYAVSYPRETIGPGRIVAVIILCVIAIYLLNSAFYSGPGDLQAEFKPTQRCYPGGSCYNAGDEQWGGAGANLLLSINLLQGIIILNAFIGVVHLIKNRFLKHT